MRTIVAATIISTLLAPAALAGNPFQEAFDTCQEQEARSLSTGIQISGQPINTNNKGWVINWDGTRSAVVHQWDRFAPELRGWIDRTVAK